MRALLIAFGLLETVAPERIIEPCERLSFENPETGQLRPWTIPMARLEGVVFVSLLVRGGKRVRRLRTPIAAFGIVMALLPQTVVSVALEAAYENADELEVRRWVVPATRLLGACYVLAALLAGRVNAPEDGHSE
ncbi:hypothetical protein EA462_03370 [Natrarchaeobius halalkaliphilus]|uniref:Uncharacterized protein n=1 Tax=Natrarchaeobius halalkaliphilus TaxID=1679091 RepID=A0A3N6MAG1_9EURY|nr:hypothetical protein [Natrarchaeobius halalkaliphilus]RQG93330.1 hypothetical protein EA462_03370 [Natrarchaeobius halalkaliphilus]